MTLAGHSKVALGVLILLVGVGTPVAVFTMMNLNPQNPAANQVELTLLYNAGAMIEADGSRVYIDPVSLPDNYSSYPADAILITHPHGDHYNSTIVQMLQKDGTVNVFPKTMADAITEFDGVGVSPRDHVQVGSINITAFYMYTFAPEGYNASHPIEENYTSYIIEIGEFTVFHAGDSKVIDEYEELTGTIDVALLPLGPGCQTMYRAEVVDAVEIISPKYFVPIHYVPPEESVFSLLHGDQVEAANCELIILEYFASHTFQP